MLIVIMRKQVYIASTIFSGKLDVDTLGRIIWEAIPTVPLLCRISRLFLIIVINT